VTWFMLFSNSWNVDGADHLGIFLFDALERLEREPLREVDFSSRGAMIVVIMTILRLLNHGTTRTSPHGWFTSPAQRQSTPGQRYDNEAGHSEVRTPIEQLVSGMESRHGEKAKVHRRQPLFMEPASVLSCRPLVLHCLQRRA